jgi:molecular chaperone DnaK
MIKRKYHLWVLAVLLCGCTNRTANKSIVLERDSAAVGDRGILVENVGLETLGGVFTPLLKTGCVTPCKDAEIFSTAQDNQTKLQVTIYRGKEKLVSSNHLLGRCYVVAIPTAPRGIPNIEVTVEAAEKEIRIQALDKTSMKPLAIQCDQK